METNEEEGVTKNSPYCRRVLLVSTVSSGVAIGYGFTSLNPLVAVISEVFNGTYHKRNGVYLTSTALTTLLSVSISMAIAGGFFGSIVVSRILRILSRKQTMILLNCLIFVGNIVVSLGSGLTGSYEAFMIGRFISGFGVGIGINTLPVVIAELCARKFQQKFQSAIGMSVSMGAVLGPVISHPQVLGGMHQWPWAVAFGCLPSLVYVANSTWCPNTPYIILRKINRAEALKVLRKLRIGSQPSIENEMKQIETEQSGFSKHKIQADDSSSKTINYLGIKAILKNPRFRLQFFVVVVLYCTLTLSGVNHVILYSDEIFRASGIPSNVVTYITIGVLALQALGSVVGMKVITILGARKLTLINLGCGILAHIITTIGLVLSESFSAAGYVAIIGILLFLVSFSSGPNIAIFALAADITIEPTRQTILNYAGGLFWITSWIVAFSAPYMDGAMHGYSFLVWCGCTIAGWLLIYRLIPETKEQTMAEIQRDLTK